MKRGTIEPHKLFKLYKGLYEQRSSGWLHLSHQSGVRKLYIEHGCPSLVVSKAPQEQLLNRLIHEGICSTSEVAEVEQKAREEETPIATLLIEMRLISEPRLDQVLIDLTAEVVWRSLSWRQGEFGWVDERAQPPLSIPVDPIILLGMGGQVILSAEEREAIWRRASGARAQLPRMHPDEERAVMDLIGQESAQALRRGAVLNTLPLRESEEHHAALCGLLISGLLKLSADAQRGQERPHEHTSRGEQVKRHAEPSAPLPTPQAISPTPPVPSPISPPVPPPVPAPVAQPEINPQAMVRPPRTGEPSRVADQVVAQPLQTSSGPDVSASTQTSTPAPPNPPAGFIDERARVRRPSITSPSAQDAQSRGAQSQSPGSERVDERGATRARRIIRPPENWRRFSISQRDEAPNSTSAPAVSSPATSAHTSTPVVAPTPQATSPVVNPSFTPPPPMPMVSPTVTPPPQASTSKISPPPPMPSAMVMNTPVAPSPMPSAVTPPMPSAVTPPAPAAVAPMPPPRPVARAAGTRQAKRVKRQPPAKIQARVDRLIELYHQREELSHYELLDVEPSVAPDQLSRVFKKLIAHLHIDQYLRFDFTDETLDQLKQLFITVNRAYQTLNDPEQRREYDLTRSLGGEAGGDQDASPQRDLGQLLLAEQLTREAINFVKRGKLDLAQEKVEGALNINADDPLSESVKICIDAQRAKSSDAPIATLRTFIDRLEALVITYEGREEPFLYLGVLYGYCQEYKRGIKALERALEINPHFAEASSQLRHLQRLDSGGGEAKRSGLFKRR